MKKTIKAKTQKLNEGYEKSFQYVGLHDNSVAEIVANDGTKMRVIKIAYKNKNEQTEAHYVYVRRDEVNKLSQQSYIYIIAYDTKYGNLVKPWHTLGDLLVTYPTLQLFIPTQAVNILDPTNEGK